MSAPCTILVHAYGSAYQRTNCLPETGGHTNTVLYIGVGLLLVGVLIALLLLRESA